MNYKGDHSETGKDSELNVLTVPLPQPAGPRRLEDYAV